MKNKEYKPSLETIAAELNYFLNRDGHVEVTGVNELKLVLFSSCPCTVALKVLNVEDDESGDGTGKTAEEYRAIIHSICGKYRNCEDCPHRGGYCLEHSSEMAGYKLLKAWAENLEAKEAELRRKRYEEENSRSF